RSRRPPPAPFPTRCSSDLARGDREIQASEFGAPKQRERPLARRLAAENLLRQGGDGIGHAREPRMAAVVPARACASREERPCSRGRKSTRLNSSHQIISYA